MGFDLKKYKTTFNELYGPEPLLIENQLKRYERLFRNYVHHFDETEWRLFSAPGRAELGGNHTDHNHGKVLAASVHLDSIAVAGKNADNTMILYSQGYDQPFEVDLTDLAVNEQEQGTTTALVRGIAARFKELGAETGGINMVMSSDVFPGSGLSSSASVEMLIAAVLNTLYNKGQFTAEELAQIGRYAENVYFGKPCGLMDQLACSVGSIISIDFKAPSKPLINKIHFDFGRYGYSLVVVNTGGSHADLTADYASIPAEMKSIAQQFGVQTLREVSEEDFLRKIPALRKQAGDRAVLRAWHYFQENRRVELQAAALQSGDLNTFLELVRESGNSSFKWLQNSYSAHSVNKQGIALALALSERFIAETGEGACRVHGGGFAGSVQMFLPTDAIHSYKTIMEPVFGKASIQRLHIRSVGIKVIEPLPA